MIPRVATAVVAALCAAVGVSLWTPVTRAWTRVEAAQRAVLMVVTIRHDERARIRRYMNDVDLGQRGREPLIAVAVLLAAIQRSPNVRDPRREPERSRRLRDRLLRAMLEQRRITREQYEAAVKSGTIPAHG